MRQHAWGLALSHAQEPVSVLAPEQGVLKLLRKYETNRPYPGRVSSGCQCQQLPAQFQLLHACGPYGQCIYTALNVCKACFRPFSAWLSLFLCMCVGKGTSVSLAGIPASINACSTGHMLFVSVERCLLLQQLLAHMWTMCSTGLPCGVASVV